VVGAERGLDALPVSRKILSIMATMQRIRVVLCSAVAAGLLVAAPVWGASADQAFPACGGGKGDKDVKKPKDGDGDQKPPPSPAASELCGGGKGDKDVKKPKDGDGDQKPPPSPA
jgi:hypothetical protein